MNKRFTKLIFLLPTIALIALSACKKESASNLVINYNYEYYPVDSGHYIIYDVDSVTFSYDNDAGKYHHDTSHYQMQAFFGDTIHDLLDSVNFRVFYATRPYANSSWGTPYGTYGLRTKTNLQAVENDIRFIKLVFPLQGNETWNGNLYVPSANQYTSYQDPYAVFAGWNYYFENTDTTIVLYGLTFNHSVVVSEVNNISQINKEVRTEIYAQNVGLIYQEWESLSKQGGNILLGFDTAATSGFSLHMRAIAYH